MDTVLQLSLDAFKRYGSPDQLEHILESERGPQDVKVCAKNGGPMGTPTSKLVIFDKPKPRGIHILIYTYTYTYIYSYTHTHIYIYRYTCTYTYKHIHIYTSIYLSYPILSYLILSINKFTSGTCIPWYPTYLVNPHNISRSVPWTTWWFHLLFSIIFRMMIPNDEHIFQGWLNYQPVFLSGNRTLQCKKSF